MLPTNSLTNLLTNQPMEASNIFRKKSSFQVQHEEIGRKIKRKFVTFKDQGKEDDSHQNESTNKSDDFPPPPAELERSSECEETGLLSVEDENEGSGNSEPLPAGTRPRLKISRIRAPGSSGQPLPAPPPPLSPVPGRPRVKRAPAPPPPKL